MAEQDKSKKDEIIPCEVCLKEIPESEAKVSEAQDYVRHFCGLECFEKWEEKAKKAE